VLHFLFDFKEFTSGMAFVGDNRACAIRGTRKENYVYSLNGWAESGEASVGIQENESLAQMWHKCPGYVSEAGLHELERREVLGNKGLWNYKMLRIFGCVAYSHVNHGKLKPRAIKYIFLEYPNGVKGYRLWRLDDVKPKNSEDHLKKDCPKSNKKKSTSLVKKNARQVSSMHSKGYDNGDVLMVGSEEMFLEWIMDSGACAIRGTRKVRVQMKYGSSFVLENVCYIPELKRKLISLGTLDREAYTMKLRNGRVKGEASIGIQENESLAQMWHKCPGHISEAGLHELERREVLGNKGLGKLEFYENYVLVKSTRVRFGQDQYTTEGVIDYVHADLWVLLGWNQHKNKALNKFKEWKQLVENHTDGKLKKLRTDNRTSQQKGLVESMNRTLLNNVMCLLIQPGLLDLFWAEATVTTTYLISRSSFTALEKKTPMD
ncbi:retrovirus-related pol polyprotein from transposon TNT 1-94, partial [Tanacetum coccineum]